MEIPLIPDLSNPKWLIIQQILKNISSKRSQKIELFFNVAKNCVRLNKVHQFTKESVGKKVIRAFHLTSELIGTSKLFNIGVRELAVD